MKTIKSKRFLLIALVVILAICLAFFLEKKFHRRFSPPRTTSQQTVSLKDQPLVTCAAVDKDCAVKNEKIKTSRLSGTTVDYARHQCDGPRACPTPDQKNEDGFVSAIREYAKEPNLEVHRITGVNPAGFIYYCADDNRCWSVDSKSNEVAAIQSKEKQVTPSP